MRRALPCLLMLLLTTCDPDDGRGQAGREDGVGTVTGHLLVYRARSNRAPAQASLLRRHAQAGPRVHADVAPLHRLPADESALVPSEVLVRFESSDVTAQAALERMAVEGLSVTHAGWGTRHLHRLRFTRGDQRPLSAREVSALAQELARRPGVRFATVNRRVYPAAIPDDRYYPLQWNYATLNLPAAWEIRTGASQVVVAVLDTGVRPHSDLLPQLLPGVDVISDPEAAADGDGRDLNPLDVGGDLPRGNSSWHGTHVMGTVGAATNNGRGVAGVAWEARILPVRVLGRAGGSTVDLIAGIAWAVGEEIPGIEAQNPSPAQVINLSLGSEGDPDPALQDVIDLATQRGAIIVVAAGNEAEETARKFPCNQRNVVCVGATRLSGAPASYSNLGEAVDVMAPGGEASEDLDGNDFADGVLSTSFDQEAQPLYAFQQGTSMAAPHVSGVVALMKAANPSLDFAQVEAILKDTAAAAYRCPQGCGAGLVNAQSALLRAMGLPSPAGPARLTVPIGSLLLEGNRPVSLQLINTGGAPLEVTASFRARSGGDFLLFPTGAARRIAPGGQSELEVAASLNGLAPGNYEGVLRLTPSEGEVQALPVRLRVGELAADRPATLLFVFEDELGEWRIAGATEVLPENNYTYSVELPPGRYFAIAGIDEDEDGELFEVGERVGIYRTIDGPEPVLVVEDTVTSDINFPLVPYTGLSETEALLVVGAACQVDADCPGGLCDTSVPGGYCFVGCQSGQCPAGSTCYAEGAAAEPRCLAVCRNPGAGQSNCRQGLSCMEDDVGGGYCAGP